MTKCALVHLFAFLTKHFSRPERYLHGISTWKNTRRCPEIYVGSTYEIFFARTTHSLQFVLCCVIPVHESSSVDLAPNAAPEHVNSISILQPKIPEIYCYYFSTTSCAAIDMRYRHHQDDLCVEKQIET